MIDKLYIDQLKKQYSIYLRNLILHVPFYPIRLRGGLKKASTISELHKAIASFLLREKKNGQPGWLIEWEEWNSRKLGSQRWPRAIIIESEEDYIYLLSVSEEIRKFKQLVNILLQWNGEIRLWLAERPGKVLDHYSSWKGICAVVDYLLVHDVSSRYIRTIPVPVHTKFIQYNQSIILSILKHLQPDKYPGETKDLESALKLMTKPKLYLIRWLDSYLASEYTSSMEIMAISSKDMASVNWQVKEIFLVENETNLYLLPQRKKSLAIVSKGYALHDLSDIPMFNQSFIYYWGDLDEDGYIMLDHFRRYYPQLQSVLMDKKTVDFHWKEMETIQYRYKRQDLKLTPGEAEAYKKLMESSGRIEQEKLLQEYVQQQLHQITGAVI